MGKPLLHTAVSLAVAAAALIDPASAAAQTDAENAAAPACTTVPLYARADGSVPEQQVDGITYLSGGIGAPEAQALRAQRDAYALAMTFARQRQEGEASDPLLAAVHVEVQRSDGTPVLCLDDAGPYLLVRLPAGRYRVAAHTEQHAETTQDVEVADGQSRRLLFMWTQ